ncbi:hypothetical protein SOM12_21005 [Flavobacterium sp. CFBP9031]|uniref:hypothetical protein n=1 Tax=Flavobacterium sp. CFBP9031 TaxID=3096538 RepID=UPI002A69B548|nr:hypothetical protein [Flavobacterium sp. CFBP9031]MDY0989924.1 hypothetical protein [Flavobacterium sp. CFBP9031]
MEGLKDPQEDLRVLSIKAIDLNEKQTKDQVLKSLLDIAKNDKKTIARANAIVKLASTGDTSYKTLMEESIKEQSYNVIAAGLAGLTKYAPAEADKALASLDDDTQKHVTPLMKRFSSQK